jgi:hypothetical protein
MDTNLSIWTTFAKLIEEKVAWMESIESKPINVEQVATTRTLG